jgi:hypothetical protein
VITHIIYHIPGRKVGCTKDLNSRKRWYPKGTEIEILDELHDKTDQEAGDIEWQLAAALGYKKGQHFADTMKIARPHSLYEEMGRRGAERLSNNVGIEVRREWCSKAGTARQSSMSKEERSALASKAHAARNMSTEDYVELGRLYGFRGGQRRVETTTFEQRSEWARRAGRVGGLKNGPLLGAMKGKCVHCGIECSLGNIHRWHNNNCKKRPMVRGN